MKRTLTAGLVVAAVALALTLGVPRVQAAGDRPNGMVVLLTDYGSQDGYPGILKGVVVSAYPDARIFDATHDLPNFDVASASYLLGQIAPEWPSGTTFAAIVDPGVGGSRKRIAVRTLPDRKLYVAPDNGLLTDVLERAEGFEARELTNEALRRPGTVSSTFHGRDWFGPVAGHLAGGVPFEQVGPPLAQVTRLPRTAPRVDGREVVGTIVYTDHYGNLLTNIGQSVLTEAGFRPGTPLEIRVGQGNWVRVPWVGTYGDVSRGQLLLTTQNGQRGVEVAVNYGNAKERLKAAAGQPLRVRVVGAR